MLVDDASRAVLELAASQYGAFHRRQAADHGLSNDRLRRAVRQGLLSLPVPNVFTVCTAASSWHQALMVASLSGAVASHRAAAALHRLDGFSPGVREISVRREEDGRFPGMINHRWSRSDERDVTIIDGIRTTTVARTLVQIGIVVPSHRVEQALDSALRRGEDLADIEATLRRLWRRGPTGAGILKGILEHPSRTGNLPDSWFERRLAGLLAEHGLPKPTLQYPVVVDSGTRRLDLAYPEVKLGLEAHSREFHFGRAKPESGSSAPSAPHCQLPVCWGS